MGLLRDSIRVCGDTQNELPRKVVKALLSFSNLNAPKLLAQLDVLLTQVGGADAFNVSFLGE